MQNWFCVDAAAVRLEPRGEAEVREIVIVSDAVEGAFVNLNGKSLQQEQKGKFQREWKRSKGVDRNEMRKSYEIRKWREGCWARIVSLFREYNLQRLQSKQEKLTEEEEMKQQQSMAFMKDLMKKIRSNGRMDARNRWWVAEVLAKDCEKAWTHTGWEDTMQK